MNRYTALFAYCPRNKRSMLVRLGILAVVVPGLLAITASTVSATQTPVTVVTDGRFDEWGAAPRIIADPADAPPQAALDLGSVLMLDDPQFIHLAVEVGRTVNVSSLRGTMRILFDADGDTFTGSTVSGLNGVDAILEFSPRNPDQPDAVGAGIFVTPVTQDGPGQMLLGYEVGALVAPTHSASRFEIRLERGTRLNEGPSLFAGSELQVKLVFEGQSGVVDETPTASYQLSTAYGNAAASYSGSIAKAEGTFRVVQWNVASESLRDRPDPFARVLAALDPDVILLDEIYGGVTDAGLESFLRQAPLDALGPWEFVLGRGGGRQKTAIASRWPIRPEERLRQVPYPQERLADLAREIEDPRFNRLLAFEQRQGLAVAGAWVDVAGREILFAPLDFQSGGYHDSPRDRLRELQASIVNDLIVAMIEPLAVTDPVVIAGDLNLVGSLRPLERLRRGLDADRGDLAVADAYRLTDRSQATWRLPDRGLFTPGRLDYLLFSGTFLAAERAFVFDAGELSDALLRQLRLERDDSRASSDHLPVVVDLRWRER